MTEVRSGSYCGRLAPSPTGRLHLGHAQTFWSAQRRARERGGTLVLRNEDLDAARCKPEFVRSMLEDLWWFGFEWQEGPDCGGAFGPYTQSERLPFHRAAFQKLREKGLVYPCTCSRRDVLLALGAPHAGEDEPLYPGTCRSKAVGGGKRGRAVPAPDEVRGGRGARVNWRVRVPDGEEIRFEDGRCGAQSFVAGKDFGDFIIWRHDDIPSYQLAVVVDDTAMKITEVVRGEDLLKSTARQLLIYRALDAAPPAFFHCPLMTDSAGVRLAKRHDALSLRALRQQGAAP